MRRGGGGSDCVSRGEKGDSQVPPSFGLAGVPALSTTRSFHFANLAAERGDMVPHPEARMGNFKLTREILW